METKTFNVTGMHCSSCSMLVTMNVQDLDGVQDVACDHATGKTVVTFDSSKTDVADIQSAIKDAGYEAALVG